MRTPTFTRFLPLIVLLLGGIGPAPGDEVNAPPKALGVPVSYQLPTDGPLPRTYRVTLALTAPDDPAWIVSTFLCGTERTVTAENQGKFTDYCNGLDDNDMPLPPGKYGVKGIFLLWERHLRPPPERSGGDAVDAALLGSAAGVTRPREVEASDETRCCPPLS